MTLIRESVDCLCILIHVYVYIRYRHVHNEKMAANIEVAPEAPQFLFI